MRAKRRTGSVRRLQLKKLFADSLWRILWPYASGAAKLCMIGTTSPDILTMDPDTPLTVEHYRDLHVLCGAVQSFPTNLPPDQDYESPEEGEATEE
jgi:hypothetical protein